jgi:toluene monooxygenase system protein E
MPDLPPTKAHKTYWHLAAARRMPTDYEIVSSRLHYYVGRGFEVDLPLGEWYRRYQAESPLGCDDWDRFRDPRETTYARYVELGQANEAHVDGILRSIEESDYDRKLPPSWVDVLERLLPPLRHCFHGLQMAAAYVGQMAPGGRITIAAAFQAADEMRRVHRLAYRMADLRRTRPTFGDESRRLWQSDPAWQPARQLVEKLLVAYDWGEAFTALNLCVKPLLDAFVLDEAGELARARGDYLWREICFALAADGAWHRDWSGALVAMLLEARPANREAFASWIDRWRPLAQTAVVGLAPLFGEGGTAAAARAFDRSGAWLTGLGVTP